MLRGFRQRFTPFSFAYGLLIGALALNAYFAVAGGGFDWWLRWDPFAVFAWGAAVGLIASAILGPASSPRDDVFWAWKISLLSSAAFFLPPALLARGTWIVWEPHMATHPYALLLVMATIFAVPVLALPIYLISHMLQTFFEIHSGVMRRIALGLMAALLLVLPARDALLSLTYANAALARRIVDGLEIAVARGDPRFDLKKASGLDWDQVSLLVPEEELSGDHCFPRGDRRISISGTERYWLERSARDMTPVTLVFHRDDGLVAWTRVDSDLIEVPAVSACFQKQPDGGFPLLPRDKGPGPRLRLQDAKPPPDRSGGGFGDLG